MMERPVERYYRDARIMNIYEGTTQMQVVAAISGILKNSLDDIFADLDGFNYSAEASKRLEGVKNARKSMLDAQAKLAESTEKMELLSRRIVRGLTLVLVAQLMLRDASIDEGHLATADRFIWEYIPEAEMQASIVLKSL